MPTSATIEDGRALRHVAQVHRGDRGDLRSDCCRPSQPSSKRRRSSAATACVHGSAAASTPSTTISTAPITRCRRHAERREELRHGLADRRRQEPASSQADGAAERRHSSASPSTSAVTLALEKPSVFITPISLSALADRLAHRVGRDQQHREEHRCRDCGDERADVAHLVGEALDERLLGRGLGLGRGVGEHARRSCARSRPRASDRRCACTTQPICPAAPRCETRSGSRNGSTRSGCRRCRRRRCRDLHPRRCRRPSA